MNTLLWLLILIIPLIAQANVKLTFHKYCKRYSSQGLTADQAARLILDSHGLQYVSIEPIAGELTDHYSPKENVVRLSESVYGQTDIAAIGVAAHECGHAIQHAESYAPVLLRGKIAPFVDLCSYGSYILIILGALLSFNETLITIGIVLFVGIVIFYMVTLPVEFDASSRALQILNSSGYLTGDEIKGTKKVLTAAALTYVAALITALLQLLRLVSMFTRRR